MDSFFYFESLDDPAFWNITLCAIVFERNLGGWWMCENKFYLKGGKREKSKSLKIPIGDMHYHFPPVSGSSQLHICSILITTVQKNVIFSIVSFFRYFWGSRHFVQIVTESVFSFILWETKQTCFCCFIKRACVAHVAH